MAEVIIAVVNFLSPTATGNVDVTSSKFAGLTPKAVIIIGGAADDSDTVERADGRWSIGFAANGSGQSVSHIEVLDNQGTSSTARRWRSDRVIRGGGSGFPLASLNAWITNGVRLNFDVVATTQRRYTAIIIGGADVSAAAGTQALGTGTDQVSDITAPAFTPDLVLLHSLFTSNGSNINTTGAKICFGAADRVGAKNYSVAFGDQNGSTTASNPNNSLYDNASMVALPITSPGTAPLFTGIVDDFDANGFSLHMTGVTAAENVSWLALKMTGADISLFDFAVETATGNKAYTTPAFLPQFVLFGSSSITTKNAPVYNTADAASIGIGAMDDTGQGAHATRDDFNVDPSDVAELQPPAALAVGTAAVPDATSATFVSLDATGFTINYGAVSGAATRTFALAIEETDVPPPPDPAPARVSQLVRLTLGLPASNPRVSQLARLTLAEMNASPRVSQFVRLTLGDYGPCHTRRAQLWKLTRRDAEVFAFTSHDRPITFGGVTFTPCNSLNASASEQTADIEGISNIEMSGIISDEAISERDIIAGKFDDAYCEVFLVSWGDAADDFVSVDSIYRLIAGWTGEVSAGERGFRAEVLGPGQRMNQRSILETYTPGCRFKFGDADCGFDIDAIKLPATVTSVTDNGFFTVDVVLGTTVATYDAGFVRWLDGENIGTDTEIKSIAFGTGDVATIVLWSPAPFLPAVGASVEIFPGCARNADACKFYDNYLNFGGFKDVPGNDQISKTPDASY